jgi:hypothetical protein
VRSIAPPQKSIPTQPLIPFFILHFSFFIPNVFPTNLTGFNCGWIVGVGEAGVTAEAIAGRFFLSLLSIVGLALYSQISPLRIVLILLEVFGVFVNPLGVIAAGFVESFHSIGSLN